MLLPPRSSSVPGKRKEAGIYLNPDLLKTCLPWFSGCFVVEYSVFGVLIDEHPFSSLHFVFRYISCILAHRVHSSIAFVGACIDFCCCGRSTAKCQMVAMMVPRIASAIMNTSSFFNASGCFTSDILRSHPHDYPILQNT